MTPSGTSEGWQRPHFERCWPLLEMALEEHPNTYRKPDVWAEIASGRAQLWPQADAVIVTTIGVYPTGLKELRGWLAAGDLDQLVTMEPEIIAWAKAQGCGRVALTGRRGWKKAFEGYRDVAAFLVKDL